MATIDERLAYLEGKVDEQSRGVNGLGDAVRHLDQKVDRFREELSARIDALDQKVDTRIGALDQKVDRFREELSSRIDALDGKVDGFRNELAARIDALDGKIVAVDLKLSSQFKWLVGIQVTVLVTVVSALLAVVLRAGL